MLNEYRLKAAAPVLRLIEDRTPPAELVALAERARAGARATRRDGAPEHRGQADSLKRVKAARVALVRVGRDAPDGNTVDPTEVQLVEIGPLGLQGWTTSRAGLIPTDAFMLIGCWLEPRGPGAAAARRATRGFLAHLEPEILRALRPARAFTQTIYNWAAVQPERRCAAIRSYPTAAGAMADSQTVAAALTFGGSLEEALSAETRWEPAALRLLARRPAFQFDSSRMRNRRRERMPGQTIERLRRTPPHVWPRNVAAWREFHALWNAFGNVRRLDDGLIDKLVADTYRRKNVQECLEMLGAGNAPGLRDCFDALDDLMRSYLLPAAVATGQAHPQNCAGVLKKANKTRALNALAALLAGDGGLRPLLIFSRAWHARLGAAPGGMLGDAGAHSAVFPPESETARLTDVPIALGGAVATPLITLGAVAEEGRVMAHCLARVYTRSIIMGEIFAFRIDGPDGLRATCTLSRDGDGLKVHDCRGYRDEQDDPERYAAIAEDLRRRLDGRAPTGGEDLYRRYNEACGLAGMLRQPAIAGERAAETHDFFQPLLVKRLRAETPEAALAGPFFEVARKLCRKTWTDARRAEHTRSRPDPRQLTLAA